VNTIIQGDPIATVILSVEAEEKLGHVIEEVLVRSALDNQMSSMAGMSTKGGVVQ
jgi:hypothetical protein